MSSIGIAVVGCGYWGPNLIRNFARVRGGQLVALCDRDSARLEAAGRDHPTVLRVPEFDALLEDASVDAVVIATSAATHHRLAKKALLSGKHVYIEKPMCLRAVDAADLVATAARQGRRLMVGHLLEYHPAVEFLKGYIEAGHLGDVRYVYSQRLNLGQVRHDENALWSLGPHDIAIANFLLAERPLEVCALGQSYLQSGIQDQLCSAYGGVNFIEMRTYPMAQVSPIAVPDPVWWELERRLVLVFLGKTHSSSAVHEQVR